MDEKSILVIVFAVAAAIWFLGTKHYEIYERLYPKFMGLCLTVYLCFITWLSAINSTVGKVESYLLKKGIDLDIKTDIELVYSDLKYIFYSSLIIFAVILYVGFIALIGLEISTKERKNNTK